MQPHSLVIVSCIQQQDTVSKISRVMNDRWPYVSSYSPLSQRYRRSTTPHFIFDAPRSTCESDWHFRHPFIEQICWGNTALGPATTSGSWGHGNWVMSARRARCKWYGLVNTIYRVQQFKTSNGIHKFITLIRFQHYLGQLQIMCTNETPKVCYITSSVSPKGDCSSRLGGHVYTHSHALCSMVCRSRHIHIV